MEQELGRGPGMRLSVRPAGVRYTICQLKQDKREEIEEAVNFYSSSNSFLYLLLSWKNRYCVVTVFSWSWNYLNFFSILNWGLFKRAGFDKEQEGEKVIEI